MGTPSRRVHYQVRGFARRVWLLAAAGVATAAVVMAVTGTRQSVRLTSADSIPITNAVSVTPAPGWTVADRGPNWVALSNSDSSAQLQVAVKPAGGADLVGMLRADVNQLAGTPAAGLTDVKDLGAPVTKDLDGTNFQREAFVNYTADVSSPQGPIPVIGTFNELLNTSTRQTAFVNFRQNDNATLQVDDDGGAMISSML